ncbi:glycosyltransferase [Phenylobacterium sp.]|uniref:glycosyltransferase n=1 Tax=Phenylobacterium sp. TaxID=1871053 RepID=UPI002DE9978B|nr:glycosyltransferase [Phenylobacterium sp.]
MRRIVYCFYSGGGLVGGHKMILRHVETLRDLGFDAVAYTGKTNTIPAWFEHRAPIVVAGPVNPARDQLVLPDDAVNTMRQMSATGHRPVIFVQNHYAFAAGPMEMVDLYPPQRAPHFLGVSEAIGGMLRRLYPQATVEIVPAFADERVFRPAAAKGPGVAASPRKRPLEADVIRNLLGALHSRHAELPWRILKDASERETAQAFGEASLFLSLSRLEGLGMTPLEAMASGCVCAGFTGVAGRDYATADNGFWVGENDCEAATEALAQAADLVAAGGAPLNHHLDAGFETARTWSYAAFREGLEETWMRLAPDARIRNGPLD